MNASKVNANSLQEIDADLKNINVQTNQNKNEIDKVAGELEEVKSKINTPIMYKEVIRPQGVTNADMYILDFDPAMESVHPMYFLKFVKKYVDVSSDIWETKLLYIYNHLKGDAGRWAQRYLTEWEDYQQFEKAFRNRFWGTEAQDKFESRLKSRGNFRVGKDSLCQYVMDAYTTTTYLDKKYDIMTFLQYISKHLPMMVRSSMIMKDISTFEELEKMMRQLEESLDMAGRKNYSALYKEINENNYETLNKGAYNTQPDYKVRLTQLGENNKLQSATNSPENNGNSNREETHDNQRDEDKYENKRTRNSNGWQRYGDHGGGKFVNNYRGRGGMVNNHYDRRRDQDRYYDKHQSQRDGVKKYE